MAQNESQLMAFHGGHAANEAANEGPRKGVNESWLLQHCPPPSPPARALELATMQDAGQLMDTGDPEWGGRGIYRVAWNEGLLWDTKMGSPGLVLAEAAVWKERECVEMQLLFSLSREACDPSFIIPFSQRGSARSGNFSKVTQLTNAYGIQTQNGLTPECMHLPLPLGL